MMRSLKKSVCLLLALLVLALCTACAQQNSNIPLPPSYPSSGPAAQPAPAAPNADVEPWQHAYHSLATESVAKKKGVQAEMQYLYYPQEGPPLLSISFAAVAEEGAEAEATLTTNKMWKMQGDEAALVYEGPGNLYINTQTGNPVVQTQEEGKTIAREITGGGAVDLYELQPAANGQNGIYFYADAAQYSWEQNMAEQPLRQLPIAAAYDALQLNPTKVSLSGQAIKQKLSDYFLGTYKPSIPKEAPEWVNTFMKYIRTHFSFAYAEGDATVDAYEELAAIQEFTIFRPVLPGAVPILFMQDIRRDDSAYQNYHVIGEHGIYVFSLGTVGGCYLYEDANANVVVCEWGESGIRDWYTVEPDGIAWQFRDGWYQVDGSNVLPKNTAGQLLEEEGTDSSGSGTGGYQGDEYTGVTVLGFSGGEAKTFNSWDRANRWVEENRPELLALYGYEGELTLLGGSPGQLQPGYTWQKMETMLIDALCEYAKKLNQWDV